MTAQIWVVDQNVQYYNMAISKRHQILYAKKPIKVKQVYKLFIFQLFEEKSLNYRLFRLRQVKEYPYSKYRFINLQKTASIAQ